jgi:rare lipoprotein A
MQARRVFKFSPGLIISKSTLSFSTSMGRGPALSLLAGAAGLSLAGCAQQPQHLASGHGKEYFPSSIYGAASPRVIADGQPVPHGGGSYLVGKPYTVAGHTYYPSEKHYAATGLASWYGEAFHGRRTANGEVYDRESISAAHPTMPLPSYARVTNLRNHYSMVVRVNDRGPFAANRIMDVSHKVAESLAFDRTGTAKVKVEYIANASLAGSDDSKLLATLRNDGVPASLERASSTMVAEAAAPSPLRTASLQSDDQPSSTPGALGKLIEKETRSIGTSASAAAPGPALMGPAPVPPARPYDLGSPQILSHAAQIAGH